MGGRCVERAKMRAVELTGQVVSGSAGVCDGSCESSLTGAV